MITPNTFPTPNMLIDELQEYLTAAEQAVSIRATRLFFGCFGSDNMPIREFSAGDFTKGVWIEDQQVMGKCGLLSESAIRTAIKSLVQAGVFTHTGNKTSKGVMYTLQTKTADYQWDWLKERQATYSYSNPSVGVKKRDPSHPRLKSSSKGKLLKAQWVGDFDNRSLFFARLRKVVNITQANALLDYHGPDIESVIAKNQPNVLTAVPGVGNETASNLITRYDAAWQPPQEKQTTLQQRSNNAASRLRSEVNPTIDNSEFYQEYKKHLNAYTDDQIVGCAKYLATDPYFSTRPVTPSVIRRNIHSWIENGMPATHKSGTIADLVSVGTHVPANGRVNERDAALAMYGVS